MECLVLPSHPKISVAVAISGGIDSAVTAVILKNNGCDVYGVHFIIPSDENIISSRLESARIICDFLHIPFTAIDIREKFEKYIIKPFVYAYLSGTTPNPCVLCNPEVKFESLLSYAERLGINLISTGHYAITQKNGNHTILLRGVDSKKDQSYFMHRLEQRILSRSLFPLGEMKKDNVREIALSTGLPVNPSSESQEICFISPDQDYRNLLEPYTKKEGLIKGSFISPDGKILGSHNGSWRYTIGQRRGLGISSPRPFYVREINTATGDVIIDKKENIYSHQVTAVDMIWQKKIPMSPGSRVYGQLRNKHKAAIGSILDSANNTATFIFDEPQWAITPGQAIAFYDGNQVIGGGWIK